MQAGKRSQEEAVLTTGRADRTKYLISLVKVELLRVMYLQISIAHVPRRGERRKSNNVCYGWMGGWMYVCTCEMGL
eukprot:56429-Eustigmatos_ZCMA.PRE.1